MNTAMTTSHGFVSVFAPQLEAVPGVQAGDGLLRRLPGLVPAQVRQPTAPATTGSVFDRDTVEGWVAEQLDPIGPVPVLDVLHPRRRPLAAGPRTRGRLRAVATGGKPGSFAAHPYLLTSEEIDRFFTAAAHLQASSPWRWQAVAFFTLMHSCGLRTGEARALRTEQVDLRSAGASRSSGPRATAAAACPLTREVIDVLAACDRASRARFPSRETFFVSAQPGTRSPPRLSGWCSTGSGTRPGCPGRRAGPATPIRLPASLRLRQHRTVGGPRRGGDRAAALPVALHGSRGVRVHLLLRAHLARLHARLRRHRRLPARRCCRRWGSNETRPGHRRPELVQLRQGLPARLHAQGPQRCPRRRSRPTGSAWSATWAT